MVSNDSDKGPGGRPTADERNRQMGEVISWLDSEEGKRDQSISPSLITSELKPSLSLVRARTIVKTLTRVMKSHEPSPEGFRFVGGQDSYYKSQLGRHEDLKQAVAKKVAEELDEVTSLAAGPGTTVADAIPYIMDANEGSSPSIVTNSVAVQQALFTQKANLEMTGGTYSRDIHAFVGEQTISFFRKANFSRAIVGVSGIDKEGNLYVKYSSEIPVVQQILNSTTETIYILATVRKLGKSDTWPIAKLKEIQDSATVSVITNPMEDFLGGSRDEWTDKAAYERAVKRKEKAHATLDNIEEFVIRTEPTYPNKD